VVSAAILPVTLAIIAPFILAAWYQAAASPICATGWESALAGIEKLWTSLKKGRFLAGRQLDCSPGLN